MAEHKVIYSRWADDTTLHEDSYFNIIESLEGDDSSHAFQLMDLLERLAIAYLASDASKDDPQAMELLLNRNGSVNDRVYWSHLEHASKDPRAKDRLKNWLRTNRRAIGRRDLHEALEEI